MILHVNGLINKSDGNICIIYRQIHNIHIDDLINPNKTHVGLLVKKEKIKRQPKIERYNRDVGALEFIICSMLSWL